MTDKQAMGHPAPQKPSTDSLRKRIEEAINSFSAENGSDTPDFILADYLLSCLSAWDCATVRRDEWYGHTKTKRSEP